MHIYAKALGKGIPPQNTFSPLYDAMNANKAAAANNKAAFDKASKDAIAMETQLATLNELASGHGCKAFLVQADMIRLVRSSKGMDYSMALDITELPLNDGLFLRNTVKAAFDRPVYRASDGKAELPDEGGLVDAETFANAMRAMVWQGEAKPSESELKRASAFVSKNGGEACASAILAKYGKRVAPTPDGVARHLMELRLEEEAKQEGKLDDL